MAYRYPPPSFAKLNEQNIPIFTPVVNFNIPPPGYGASRSIEGSTGDVRYENYPSVSSKKEMKKDAIRYCPPPCSKDESKQNIHFGHCPSQQQFQQSSEIFNNCPVKSIEEKQEDNVFSQTHSVLEQKLHLKNNRVKKKTSQTLKICEAKELLQSSMKNLEELQGLQKSLKLDYQNLNPASWKETWGHIRNLMVQVDTSLKKLSNPSSLEMLKKLLIMRTKKRKREKRKHAVLREVKVESFGRRQHLHEHINKWLKEMEDVVEKAKREESLKYEADQVLSEVTRRKTEARKQLNMLKALQKLRLIRAQTLSNQGQRMNTENGIRFNRVIEHLKKLWEDQLKDYEVEEQGLRVMLEEAVEERNKSEVVQIKQTLLQWEELLFGKRGPINEFYQAAERNKEAFIATRKSWDQFLAPPGAVMSSSIPIGWIIPANPSSSEWEAFQSKK